jgi:hypothetical protein
MGTAFKGCAGLMVDGDAEYTKKAMETLEEIEDTKVGKAFFKELASTMAKTGKKVNIKYVANQGNCCMAWGAGQYIKLIEDAGKGGGNAADRVMHAMNEAREKDKDLKTYEAIAERIYRTVKPSLKPNFSNKNPLTTAKPGPNIVKQILDRIQAWTTDPKAFLGEKPEIRETVLLVLEDYWEPGSKTNCSVCFDPSKTTVGGKARPLSVALFHEMVHAYYSIQGRQLGHDNPPSANNTLYEAMCVGLPPHFHDRPFSENKIRAEMKVPLREFYEV